MIIDLDISWQVSIVILLIVIFLIYLCFGGGDHKYIGLSPLEIGFDASRQTKHSDASDKIDETEESEEYETLNCVTI